MLGLKDPKAVADEASAMKGGGNGGGKLVLRRRGRLYCRPSATGQAASHAANPNYSTTSQSTTAQTTGTAEGLG